MNVNVIISPCWYGVCDICCIGGTDMDTDYIMNVIYSSDPT